MTECARHSPHEYSRCAHLGDWFVAEVRATGHVDINHHLCLAALDARMWVYAPHDAVDRFDHWEALMRQLPAESV